MSILYLELVFAGFAFASFDVKHSPHKSFEKNTKPFESRACQ
jgi:hypothetical protein